MNEEYRKKLENGGIDVGGAIKRFSNNDVLYEKYIRKFGEDETFNELLKAYENKEYKPLFEAAHNLKGVCANFGINNVSAVAGKIVEALRAQKYDDIDELVSKLTTEYKNVLDVLK